MLKVLMSSKGVRTASSPGDGTFITSSSLDVTGVRATCILDKLGYVNH
jgi:hypothetical protein